MPRTDFTRDLRSLQDEILLMGSMAEKAIIKAMDALKSRDLALARAVIDEDEFIDQKRFDVEDHCVHIIATQSPVATDLRYIIAVIHISSELERMADYAEGIAKISVMMGDEPPLKPLIDLPRMAETTTDMLRRSLDALVNRDVVAARQVCDDDDIVDNIYDQVFRELLTYMLEDPRTIRRATYLLWVSHDLERVADRATNIAKNVIYLVTGNKKGAKVSA